MKVLVSAYACDPRRGSEPGVGWAWSLEIARRGHSVWILTRLKNVAVINEAAALEPQINLQAVGYDLPTWLRGWKRGARGVQIYYALWQIGAFLKARQIHRKHRFDLVHHLTFGVFRTPGLMSALGVPFVFGPVGGAEFTPRPLARHFGPRARAVEALRKTANYASLFDPLLWMTLKKARWIFSCTPETARFLPKRFASKIKIESIIGADAALPLGPVPHYEPGKLKLLFVGRMLHWKGVELAVRALALARVDEPGLQLTLLGKGLEKDRLCRLATQLGLDDSLTWLTWLEDDELIELYAKSHALVFPSLHESGGLVVFEAMQRGLPVLCLDIGGPAMHVNSERGACIEVHGRSEKQVLEAMANTLTRWARNPSLLEPMREQCHRYCKEHEWAEKVARVYAPIEAELELPAS